MMTPIADLHMHTLMSGHAFGTVREMAAAAAEKHLQLIGVTEHGPGIPGTCDPIYFRNFGDAPRQLYGVQMLYGSEVNILPGGQLSLDRRHLDCLDYAIAGIHGFCYEDVGMVKNTDNILKCMEDPKVRIISHPDTILFPLDYAVLAEGAAANGVALEVNNSSLLKPSLRPGCVENYKTMLPLCMRHRTMVTVNSDAHDPYFVGEVSAALALLDELEFDQALILNNDLGKLKAFLL